MGRIVAAYAYQNGRRVAEIPLGDSICWVREEDSFVWIGFHEPTEQDLRTLQAQFRLHELAVEDALHAHQLPKVEVYGDSLFLALRTAELQDGRIAFGETHIFVGADYIITVRHGASRSYTQVRERCEARPALLRHGVDYVLHALLDYVVDNYQPVIEELEQEVDALEERLIGSQGLTQDDVQRIYELRRQLVRLRRVVAPMVEVCSRLRHLNMPFLDKTVRPYFKDVLDHVNRVNEAIDGLREVLSFAFEAAMLMQSSRQGDISRRVAGWAAILAVPTAIAGVYGMNFDHMPELHWAYGYYLVLGLIFGVSGVLFVKFRRWGWI